jgi:N-methylhydantoinase A/oxoprolinase/acetone carboxylase beta subunit
VLIGIDVGGTFTDGVLFDGTKIVISVKHPTDKRNLKATLLQVLDDLLKASAGAAIERIVFSTTLVTNLLATNSGDKTALLLLPGPGLPLEAYRLFPETHFLKGSVDFRGRELEAVDQTEVAKVIDAINIQGIKKIAVVGKFSNRNSSQEQEVRRLIMQRYPGMAVAIGSETAGQASMTNISPERFVYGFRACNPFISARG